jgi:hypothetical protein
MALADFADFADFANMDDPEFIDTKWITINDQVVREISALQLVYKRSQFDHYWHIVGTLLGKRVSWELSELEPEEDDEDDTRAKACLEYLRRLVAKEAGHWLAVYCDGEEISDFKFLFTPGRNYNILQITDFDEW